MGTTDRVTGCPECKVPVEAVRYLLDIFIEGGYVEADDVPHIDEVYEWLILCGYGKALT